MRNGDFSLLFFWMAIGNERRKGGSASQPATDWLLERLCVCKRPLTRRRGLSSSRRAMSANRFCFCCTCTPLWCRNDSSRHLEAYKKTKKLRWRWWNETPSIHRHHGYYKTFHRDNYNCDQGESMAKENHREASDWTLKCRGKEEGDRGWEEFVILRASNCWKLTCKFNKLANRNEAVQSDGWMVWLASY